MPEVVKTVGRYEILRELGRGGMAMVFLARQTDLDRFVALKELGAFHASDPSFAQRFIRESRVAGALSHPNIVTVHDYFEHDGTPYIAMEYVERGSLRPYVGHMTLNQIAGVLEGMLAGLAAAEAHGIVHRDLKPENIMVTSDGRVKIADFGIAKATQSSQTGAFLTATGTTVGTPTYMAPEQAMAQEVGPWTDLYSIGCMAFEMFTGNPPFHDSDAPMAILLRHVNEPIPRVSSVNPEIDQHIADWVEHMVVKDPKQRLQSATTAWDEFEEIIIGKLGPRWRREARLLEEPGKSVSIGGTTPPPPLTPAPFEATQAEDDAELQSFAWGNQASNGAATPPPMQAPPGPATPPDVPVADSTGFVTFGAPKIAPDPPPAPAPPPAQAPPPPDPAAATPPPPVETPPQAPAQEEDTEEATFETYIAPAPARAASTPPPPAPAPAPPPPVEHELLPREPLPPQAAPAPAPAPPAAPSPSAAAVVDPAATVMPPALKQPPPPTQPKPVKQPDGDKGGKALLIALGVGLVMIIAAAAMVLGGGGDSPPEPVATATAPAEEAPAEEAAVNAEYATLLEKALTPVSEKSGSVRSDLAAAKTPKGQAKVAGSTASAFAAAVKDLGAADVTDTDKALNDALVAGLDKTGDGWKQLSTAANRGDRRAYGKAQDAVVGAEKDLAGAISALENIGYTVPSISTGDPIPALKAAQRTRRRRPARRPRRASGGTQQQQAPQQQAPQQQAPQQQAPQQQAPQQQAPQREAPKREAPKRDSGGDSGGEQGGGTA